jgi:hypothetical protein
MTRREFIQLIGVMGIAAAIGAGGVIGHGRVGGASVRGPAADHRWPRARWIHGTAPSGCAAADHIAPIPLDRIGRAQHRLQPWGES